MKGTIEEIAAKFGISTTKLERIRQRKDCLGNIVDADGRWDAEIVGRMLTIMKRAAEGVRKYHARKRAERNGVKPVAAKRTPKAVKKATKKVTEKAAKKAVKKVTQPSEKYTPGRQYYFIEGIPGTSESSLGLVEQFWEINRRWTLLVTDGVIPTWQLRAIVREALEFSYNAAKNEQT